MNKGTSPRSTERVVLLVGAGASVPAGYPVTPQLLDRIVEGLHDDTKSGWRSWAAMKPEIDGLQKRQKLLALLNALFPGLRGESSLTGATIVDVLSLTDLLLSEGLAAHSKATHADLREQRALLDIAINGVLQGRKAQDLRDRLAAWVIAQAGATSKSRVSIVTTNYDTLLEDAIFRHLEAAQLAAETVVDFGMPWRTVRPEPVVMRPQDAPLAVMKLHGSLNWLKCESCGYVTMNIRQRIHALSFRGRQVPEGYNVCECDGLLRSTLVVPSTVRDVRDANLLGIWQAALEEIRRADQLLILGYSIPAEDITVRSLLIRALNGRPRINGAPQPLNVEVVQYEKPDEPRPALPRFRMVFPLSQLPDQQYHVDGIEAWASRRVKSPSMEALAAAVKRIAGRRRVTISDGIGTGTLGAEKS